MQYLLNEEEYNKLIAKANLVDELPTIDRLQKFCTIVADKMPAGADWIGKNEPWGCILSKEGDWYCDGCPCTAICPNEFKSWSQ